MSLNKLFLVLLFLFSITAQAGVPQAADVSILGGSDTVPGITLPNSTAFSSTAASRPFCIMSGPVISSSGGHWIVSGWNGKVGPYQVSAGKTFVAMSLTYIIAGGQGVVYGYTTSSFTEGAGSSAMTTAGAQWFNGTNTAAATSAIPTTSGGHSMAINTTFEAPANSYPFYFNTSPSSFLAIMCGEEK